MTCRENNLRLPEHFPKFLFKDKRKRISFLNRCELYGMTFYLWEKTKQKTGTEDKELVVIFLITIRIMTKSCDAKENSTQKQDLTEEC